jgi:hypothetical protein
MKTKYEFKLRVTIRFSHLLDRLVQEKIESAWQIMAYLKKIRQFKLLINIPKISPASQNPSKCNKEPADDP